MESSTAINQWTEIYSVDYMIEYSLALIIGYVLAKWVTPYSPKLLTKKYHIHHWIWGTCLLCFLLILDVKDDVSIGLLTGIDLEGLSYKNWKIYRER